MTTLRALLMTEEGYCLKAYPDPLTHAAPWTIGVGHTGPEVHEGLVWTDAQVEAAYGRDAAVATRDAWHNCPWMLNLNDARQAVLVSMFFQMGEPRVLQFKGTLAALRDQAWNQAAGHMRDSLWAKQTPKRVARLARQVETGEWQYAPAKEPA